MVGGNTQKDQALSSSEAGSTKVYLEASPLANAADAADARQPVKQDSRFLSADDILRKHHPHYHSHQHRRHSHGAMRDDNEVHYEDVLDDGRRTSVAVDDNGHIAFPSLVPPAVQSPSDTSNDGAHDYFEELEHRRTASTSAGNPETDAAAEGPVLAPIATSPGQNRQKTKKRSESGGFNKTLSRRDTRSRSTTLPSSMKRTTSNVNLIRELRRTSTLHWDIMDLPAHDEPSPPPTSRTHAPVSDLEAGTAAAQSQKASTEASSQQPIPPPKTRTSFWKKQPNDRTKTGASHLSYRTFLKSQSSRRDGRLPISVKDTNHTGVLAKAVGAAVRRIAHGDNLDDEPTSDTEEEPSAYASAQNEAEMSLAAAEFGRISRTLAHQQSPKLNIVIMVIGSRGDIQPFLKIGRVLKNKHGHRVRVATHPAFRDFIEKDAGLEFFSVGGDPAELMAFMVKNPGMIPSLATVRSGDIGRRRDAMAEMFDGFWRACVDATDDPKDIRNKRFLGDKEPFIADAIIANPPSYVHVHCAEALGVPLHIMFTFPYTPTQAFPHPLANIKKSAVDPGYTNFISYPLIDMMVWQGLGDLVNNFRVKSLDLDPISMIWAPGSVYRMHVPFTYLWSPGLIPKPEDWGPEIDIGGFVFLELASSFTPPESLVKFLAESEEPPIYIGFGSIVVDDADSFTEMIFEAVRMTGVRALVSKGWGGFGGKGDNLPDNIYMLENTPHDWLFPQVRGCVIHGGAGTTAIALKCGLPIMVVPFFGDQYFWGSMIEKSKVGPKPVPYKRLTAERLAEGIEYLLGKEARCAAAKIAASIEIEGDGAENACKSFMRTMELEGQTSMRCAIFPDRVAVWQRKASNIRLSPLAAEALVERGYMSYKNLRLIRHTEWNDFEGPGEPITAMFGSIARSFREIVSGPFIAVGEIVSGSKKNKEARREKKAKKAKALKKKKAKSKNAQTEKADSSPTLQNGGSAGDLGEVDTLGDDDDTLDDIRGPGEPDEGSFEVVFQAVGKSVGRSAVALVMAPIELYFALCQGFHNAPRLYGDDTVRRPPHVTGIKSGLKAAGNEFVFGVYDGFTGVVRLPIRHASNGGGVRGFVKGVGMGIMGFVLKDISAGIGPVAYVLKGLAKQADRSNQPARYLRRARMMQGQREARAFGDLDWQRYSEKAVSSWESMHSLFRMVQEGKNHGDDAKKEKKAGKAKIGDEEANTNGTISTIGTAHPPLPRSASNDSVFEHHYHHGVSSNARQSLEDLDAALESADLAAVVLAAMRRGETLESVVRGRHSLSRSRRKTNCHICGGSPDRNLNMACRKQLTERWQEKGVGNDGEVLAEAVKAQAREDVGGPSRTRPDDVD